MLLSIPIQRRGLILVSAAVFVTACSETERPTGLPRVSARPLAAFSASNSAKAPARVVFDVDVESSPSAGPAAAKMHMHVDRTRGQSGKWTTTFSIPVESRIPADAPGFDQRPVSVTVDENGRATFTRANGGSWTPMTYAEIVKAGYPMVTPPTEQEKAEALRLERTLVGSKSPVNIGWIESLVRSDDERRDELARTTAGSGSPTTDARGHQHFSKSHGQSAVDIEVDPASSEVMEIRGTESGQPAVAITHRYSRNAPGWSIRTTTRAESSALRGFASRASTVTLSNLQIDGRRVQ
jgi:hypothetical protein